MGQGRQLRLVVFLEGIRIPVSQVTVSAQVNSPASARITLPASRLIEEIQPKTHVLIFFEPILQPVEELEFADRLQLLFEGEVVGVGWSQAATGAADAYIVCQDLSNYFQRAPAYFFRNNFLDQEVTETVAFTLGEDGLSNQRFLSNPGEQGLTSEIKILLLQASPDSFPRAFNEVFARTAELNVYFRRANERLRIVDTELTTSLLDFFGFRIPARKGRIALKDDPEAALLFNPKLTEIADFVLGSQDIHLPLQAVMARLMEIANYQFWPQLCPSFEVDESTNARRLVNFAIKPTTFFTIPPAFNTLLPGSYTAVDVTRDFMSEPTRLRMRFSSLDGLTRVAAAHYAPRGIKVLIDALFGREGKERVEDIGVPSSFNPFGFASIAAAVAKLEAAQGQSQVIFNIDDLRETDNPATRLFRGLLVPGDGVPVESDESLKGIIPREYPVPASVYTQGTPAVKDQYFTQLAEFLLFLAQHEARTVAITSDFNPNIALGFPMLLLQATMGPKFGEVASLTHTITDEGGGITNIIMSYTHDRDVISVDGAPEGATLRAAPLWINKAFLPKFVDEVTFEADRIDPDNPAKTKPIVGGRGLGGWRYFFGDSGVSFWRNYPAGSASASVITPELVGFSKRDAAELLLEFYQSQNEAGRSNMVDGFGRRRIATLRDMSEFLGFKIESEERLTGATFDRVTVREAVERLRLDLSMQAVRL